MCTKVESVSVRWDLYECVCSYDLRCDGGWDDLWSWPPFQPCITIIAWAGLERIILQQGEEEGGLLLGIFFLSFLALAGWLQWGIVMMSVQAHSNGLFLSFFFCARCCVSISFLLFYLAFVCTIIILFDVSRKKMAHTHDDDPSSSVLLAGWCQKEIFPFIYLFIYSFLKDSPCLASRSLVLYFLYSLCRVLFFGEENFNVRKQHFRNFHIKRKGPGCVLQLMRAA